MRRLAAELVPWLLVLALAACGSGTGPGHGEPPANAPTADAVATVEGAPGEPVAEIPVISTEAQMLAHTALPLDAYSLEFDHQLIEKARDKLVADCLVEMGFDLSQYAPYRPLFPEPPPRLPRLRQYGVGIMAEVQQYGYDTPPKYAGPSQPPVPPPMSEALATALMGPVEERPPAEPLEYGPGTVYFPGFTPDSCIGRSWAALEVADHREISTGHGSVLVTNLIVETFNRAKTDSRVVAADDAWSACMKEKGFDVPSPHEAEITYGQLDRAAGIPAATADVECKYATNYFGIRYGVEVAYQKAAIEEHFQELEAIAAAHRVTLEKAKAIVDE